LELCRFIYNYISPFISSLAINFFFFFFFFFFSSSPIAIVVAEALSPRPCYQKRPLPQNRCRPSHPPGQKVRVRERCLLQLGVVGSEKIDDDYGSYGVYIYLR
jgi:hypothetical protein